MSRARTLFAAPTIAPAAFTDGAFMTSPSAPLSTALVFANSFTPALLGGLLAPPYPVALSRSSALLRGLRDTRVKPGVLISVWTRNKPRKPSLFRAHFPLAGRPGGGS